MSSAETTFRRLEDANARGKRVLVRVDFNVPMENGRITDATRLEAAKETISVLRDQGAKIILLAHFDRPKGKRVPEMSLAPIAPALSEVIHAPVAFAEDCIGVPAKAAIDRMQNGGVLLLENTRFHAGEEANDEEFSLELAELGDIYVNDAFSCAHRAHASTEGVARLLPAYPGKQMEEELSALAAALENPERPVMGIVGGSKVSTKLDLLKNLVGNLDKLAIGGGMANTFLFAQGVDIGASMAEKDMAGTARDILAAAKLSGCEILLPVDVVTAETVERGAPSKIIPLSEIGPNDRILDAGPQTVARLVGAMDECKTLIWNGPLGVFELPPFDVGTMTAAQVAAERVKANKLIAVGGGGDTVAALNQAGVAQDFTFVSTAGGAFLEWMEGKDLPGVEALRV
ncbi:MAG: phosphoglycerate kinase [Caulobacterales bacterium]